MGAGRSGIHDTYVKYKAILDEAALHPFAICVIRELLRRVAMGESEPEEALLYCLQTGIVTGMEMEKQELAGGTKA